MFVGGTGDTSCGDDDGAGDRGPLFAAPVKCTELVPVANASTTRWGNVALPALLLGERAGVGVEEDVANVTVAGTGDWWEDWMEDTC